MRLICASQADGGEMASDPATIGLLKKQVQECLTHVRYLNEKLKSGADKNSDEIKVSQCNLWDEERREIASPQRAELNPDEHH